MSLEVTKIHENMSIKNETDFLYHKWECWHSTHYNLHRNEYYFHQLIWRGQQEHRAKDRQHLEDRRIVYLRALTVPTVSLLTLSLSSIIILTTINLTWRLNTIMPRKPEFSITHKVLDNTDIIVITAKRLIITGAHFCLRCSPHVFRAFPQD